MSLSLILFLTWVGAHASSTEAGEQSGTLALVAAGAVAVLSVTLRCVYRTRAPSLNSITELFLAFQFCRWALVLNYESSEYFQGQLGQIRRIFPPYNQLELSSDSTWLSAAGVNSTNFLQNSAGSWAWLLTGCCLVLLAKCCKHTENVRRRLLAWFFLVTFFDMVLFASVQVYNFSVGSTLDLVSSACAAATLTIYVLGALGVLVGVLKSQSSVFSEDLKETTVCRLYYPLLFGVKTVMAALLAGNSSFLYGGLMLSEGAFALYVFISLPYKIKWNSVFVSGMHFIQLLTLSVPAVTEASPFTESTMDIVSTVLVWLLAVLAFCMFILELVHRGPQKPVVVQEKKESSDDTLLVEQLPPLPAERADIEDIVEEPVQAPVVPLKLPSKTSLYSVLSGQALGLRRK